MSRRCNDTEMGAPSKKQRVHSPTPSSSLVASAPHTKAADLAISLQCVFSFLSRSEMASAVCASRIWYDAAASVECSNVADNNFYRSLGSLPSWPLCRFITDLRERHERHDRRRSVAFRSSALMHVFKERLPHLRALTARIHVMQESVFVFPSHLKELSLTDDAPGERTSEMIRVAAQMKDLKTFELRIHPWASIEDVRAINFAPLLNTKLTQFLLSHSGVTREQASGIVSLESLSPSQVSNLRALPHPGMPCTASGTRSLAARLLQHPQPTWMSIGGRGELLRVGVEISKLLGTLTTLTELHVEHARPERDNRLDYLTPLAHLTDLELSDLDGDTPAPLLLQSLQGLVGLTRLHLIFTHLSSDDMAELLPQLPSLTDLSLIQAEIPSLHFLSAAPLLTNRLVHLRLESAHMSQQLSHIHNLQALTHLAVTIRQNVSFSDIWKWMRFHPSSAARRMQINPLPPLIDFQLTICGQDVFALPKERLQWSDSLASLPFF